MNGSIFSFQFIRKVNNRKSRRDKIHVEVEQGYRVMIDILIKWMERNQFFLINQLHLEMNTMIATMSHYNTRIF